jgi:PAS domain S-box-containing protein
MSKKKDLLSKINFQIFDNMQESASIYKLIRDENNDIVDLCVLYINSASELNYIQKGNVIGKKISELYPKNLVDHYLKIVKDVISTGKSNRYETYFAPLDKYYLVLNFVYNDLHISLSMDISEQKKHEKNLKESENRYQSLFRNNYAAMLLINPETGNIVDANPAACSFYGYKKEELLKMKITDLNILTDEQIFNEMQRARRMKKNHFVFKHRLASGEIRDVDTYSGPITVGGKKLLYSIVHDITQQKKAEKALRISEHRYRTLFSSIDEGFCIIEVIFNNKLKPIDYRFLEINPAFEKQTGLINAQGKRMRELSPKHEEHWFEIYGKVALTGQPARFQNRAEQLHRWYDVYAFRFGHPQNHQVAILFNDVTKRKELEEQLKEARDNLEKQVEDRTAELEESYKSLKESESKAKEQADLLNITHEAIFVRDIDDKISFWNNGAAELYGWSKKEAIGKTLQELLQTEYIKPLKEIKNETLTRGRWEGELTHTQSNKAKINVLSRWSLQKDNINNPVGFMEVNIDITEQKKAQQKLKESEEKYRELVENANSIIIRLNRTGSIIFFNEFAEIFFGFKEDEVKGKNIVGTIVPKAESYGRDLQELMSKVITDPENYSYVENENITKHGKRVWVSWTNKGIFNKKGELQGILSIGTDITERKKSPKKS